MKNKLLTRSNMGAGSSRSKHLFGHEANASSGAQKPAHQLRPGREKKGQSAQAEPTRAVFLLKYGGRLLHS